MSKDAFPAPESETAREEGTVFAPRFGQDGLLPVVATSAKTGEVLKEKIPHSHLTYVDDAAHGIEIDQPERMLRLVKAFLERREPQWPGA